MITAYGASHTAEVRGVDVMVDRVVDLIAGMPPLGLEGFGTKLMK